MVVSLWMQFYECISVGVFVWMYFNGYISMDVPHGCISWICSWVYIIDVLIDVSHGCISWMYLMDVSHGCISWVYLMDVFQ